MGYDQGVGVVEVSSAVFVDLLFVHSQVWPLIPPTMAFLPNTSSQTVPSSMPSILSDSNESSMAEDSKSVDMSKHPSGIIPTLQ